MDANRTGDAIDARLAGKPIAASGPCKQREGETLPAWLAREERYEPLVDKTGFLAKNLLHLAGMLENVRMGGGSAALLYGKGPSSPLDRALSRVSAPLRLVGLFECILLVLMSHSSVFLMIIGCVDAVLIAARPVEGIRSTLLPSLAATIVAAVLALPAYLVGGGASMLFIAIKTLINVSLVLGLSWTVPWNRLIGALATFRMPDVVVFTLDTALKHIEILGRVATALSEALMLRSVGRTRGRYEKTTSTAGVMGATFLRAYACAQAMDEAMECRGFTGTYVRRRERFMTGPGVAYLIGLVILAVLYLTFG